MCFLPSRKRLFGISFALLSVITNTQYTTNSEFLHFNRLEYMLTVNTILADKQSLFCEGLKIILNQHPTYKFDILSEVNNSDKVTSLVSTQKVDMLILDLDLTGLDGLELIPNIRSISKDLKIIVLTNYTKHKFVKEAMKGGADAYLLKSHGKTELFEAINSVLAEKTYLGPDVNVTPPNRLKIGTKSNPKFEDRFLIRRKLTNREHEVLKLITEAKSNKEIAAVLYISDQTVGVHRKNIMKKFGVRNSVNLIRYAFENQLIG